MLTGSLLALLVVAPEVARAVVAVLLGYLPAGLLGLLGGTTGPLAAAAEAFRSLGGSIAATDPDRFGLVVGGVLLVAGALLAVGLYRHTVSRFERYAPSWVESAGLENP